MNGQISFEQIFIHPFFFFISEKSEHQPYTQMNGQFFWTNFRPSLSFSSMKNQNINLTH